jgi:hypothetical protein
VLKSVSGESFLSQMATGLETSALLGHEHDPLQQSLEILLMPFRWVREPFFFYQ